MFAAITDHCVTKFNLMVDRLVQVRLKITLAADSDNGIMTFLKISGLKRCTITVQLICLKGVYNPLFQCEARHIHINVLFIA